MRLPHLSIFLLSATLSGQTTIATFTSRDDWGASRPLQLIELPFTGGLIRPETHRVVTQRGEVAWQQLRNGNILVEPHRRASSVLSMEYNLPAGFIAHCGSDCILIQDSIGMPDGPGVLVFFPSQAPSGASAGAVYCIVSQSGSISSIQIKLSSTCGGPPITFGNSPSTALRETAFKRVGNNIYSPMAEFQAGDPVRFQVAGSGSLPGGLSADATYFLKPEANSEFSIWRNPDLTDQVMLTTDGLGAFEIISELVFEVQSGVPTRVKAANPVSSEMKNGYLEVTNGMTGLRLLTNATQTTPVGLHPVQGVLWKDGSWTATGPNKIYRENIDPTWRNGRWARSPIGDTPGWGATDPASFRMVILERGPIKTTVRYEYTWPVRPDYNQPGVGTSPSQGPGHYVFEASVYANTQFIEILDDTNMAVGYYLDLGIPADRYRYRITGSDTLDDIEADFPQNSGLRLNSYGVANEGTVTVSCATDMTSSNWWGCNSGTLSNVPYTRYGMIYQNAGGTTSKLFGVVSGWPEDSIEAGRLSRPPVLSRVISSPIHGADKVILSFQHPISSGASVHYRVQRRWGWFVGEKGDIPAIGSSLREIHKLSAVYNNEATLGLSRELSYNLSLSDPQPGCDWSTHRPCGWRWPYSDAERLANLKAKIRTDAAYFTSTLSSLQGQGDGHGEHLLRMWRDNSTASIDNALRFSKRFIRLMMRERAEQGNMGFYTGYYKLGTEVARRLPIWYAVLQDENATEQQRNTVKRWLALTANLQADKRFFCGTTCGDNLGLLNQALQMVQLRELSIIGIRHVSGMDLLAPGAISNQLNVVNVAIRDDGAVVNAPSYQGTFSGPANTATRYLVYTGAVPQVNLEPLWRKAQRFFLDQVSPVDARFNVRRRITGGDSIIEAPIETGESPFPDPNGIWMWHQVGKPRGVGWYQSTLVSIDETTVPQEPTLGSRQYPNFWQFLRHGWNTPNETYAVVHAKDREDHMHTSEQGAVQLWALNAPISTVYTSKGNPFVLDRLLKNVVAMESSLPGGRTWDQDSQPMGNNSGQSVCADVNSLCTAFGSSSQIEFSAFPGATLARSRYGSNPAWTRDVKILFDDPPNPVLVVTDTFDGNSANKILAQNFHASGAVGVPGDAIYTPVQRIHSGGNDPARPSNGKSAPNPSNFSLTSNALNLLQFNGQNTVDWKTYLIPRGGSGSLAHIGHFQVPNQGGTGMATSQYILRWRHDGDFQTVTLPYRKSQEPPGRVVEYDTAGCSGGVRIAYGSIEQCLTDFHHTFTDGTVSKLRTWGMAPAAFGGMSVSGGPAECIQSGSTVTCHVSGMQAAMRTITLPPGEWYPDRPMKSLGSNRYGVFHAGGPQPVPRTVQWTLNAAPVSTIRLSLIAPAGASEVRVLFDGEAVTSEACGTGCLVDIAAPSGTYQLKHQWLDSAGKVVHESAERQTTF